MTKPKYWKQAKVFLSKKDKVLKKLIIKYKESYPLEMHIRKNRVKRRVRIRSHSTELVNASLKICD